jgi:hypothetical protein
MDSHRRGDGHVHGDRSRLGRGIDMEMDKIISMNTDKNTDKNMDIGHGHDTKSICVEECWWPPSYPFHLKKC